MRYLGLFSQHVGKLLTRNVTLRLRVAISRLIRLKLRLARVVKLFSEFLAGRRFARFSFSVSVRSSENSTVRWASTRFEFGRIRRNQRRHGSLVRSDKNFFSRPGIVNVESRVFPLFADFNREQVNFNGRWRIIRSSELGWNCDILGKLFSDPLWKFDRDFVNCLRLSLRITSINYYYYKVSINIIIITFP